jgi:hypothetical protein
LKSLPTTAVYLPLFHEIADLMALTHNGLPLPLNFLNANQSKMAIWNCGGEMPRPRYQRPEPGAPAPSQ